MSRERNSSSASGIIAASESMRSVLRAADDVAMAPTTVLLFGESGTGKEVIARYIHNHSLRAERSWVAVNCAAIPDDLLESELFGHERGAFTGAGERRTGRIEQAHLGTLLLDEISEMPLRLQAKLLRVLQEREIDRVGGQRPISVDVRVICTSNRSLEAMVAEKLFRADLYYRINVFPITLPPLRRRPDDIEPLTRHLLDEAAAALGRQTHDLAKESLELLHKYAFPGNVRELRNLLERALIRTKNGLIGPADLGLELGTIAAPGGLFAEPPSNHFPDGAPLDLTALEHLAIAEALRRAGGNRTHAARLLGIALRTLRNKLRETPTLAQPSRHLVRPAEVTPEHENFSAQLSQEDLHHETF